MFGESVVCLGRSVLLPEGLGGRAGFGRRQQKAVAPVVIDHSSPWRALVFTKFSPMHQPLPGIPSPTPYPLITDTLDVGEAQQ